MALEVQDMSASVCAAVRKAIEETIEGATAQVSGSGGHYEIRVVSKAFADKSTRERHALQQRDDRQPCR